MSRFCRVTLSTFQTLEVWPLFETLKETLALLVVPLGYLRSESLTVPGDDKSGIAGRTPYSIAVTPAPALSFVDSYFIGIKEADLVL